MWGRFEAEGDPGNAEPDGGDRDDGALPWAHHITVPDGAVERVLAYTRDWLDETLGAGYLVERARVTMTR